MARVTSRDLDNGLGGPVLISAAAHSGVVLALLLVSSSRFVVGEAWGGVGGDSVQVSVVQQLPGVPLPRPPVVTQNRMVTESPALHREAPKPKEPEPQPEPQAKEIPRFGEKAEPVQRRPPRRETTPAVNPPGAIPRGEGGPPPLPYTPFQTGGAQGGLSFGSGGAFGTRYAWYVESVRRRVSSNWLISSVDPYVQWAPRVLVSFEILRSGAVVNIQLMQSSGVASVDRSAIRAIRDSSPLDRLPSDYAGDKVAVEFWFDFRRP